MDTKQLRSSYVMTILALFLGLVMVPAIPTEAQVTSEKTTTVSRNNESLESRLQINFETPEGQEGQPKQGTVGAGTRDAGQCSAQADSKPMTLLVPANGVALTVAERPTFFVYFPKTVAQQAELSLRDEHGNGVYQTTFDLSSTPRIMSIQLPETSPELEIGQNYQWSIAVICDGNDRLRDRVAEGWIQRTEATAQLTRQLEGASISEQVALYAQHGIWYETVSTLAQLWTQSEDSTVAANAWKQLLTNETVQLDRMLGIPLIQPQLGDS